MKKKRRDFLRTAGMTGLGIASGLNGVSAGLNPKNFSVSDFMLPNLSQTDGSSSIIGTYGSWAASLAKDPPSLSFRNDKYSDIDAWRRIAKQRVKERLSIPDIGTGIPEATVLKTSSYDGLTIEEISWQLPYGRPTQAVVLRPQGVRGKLPGILAFHDHGGNKYFGTQKIIKTSDDQNKLMADHQAQYYEGRAWANELAKKGYVVLVSDTFTFGSRRVMVEDVPKELRDGLDDRDHENPTNIERYNDWAKQHEHIMAKSLFCAGTTWPGVFLAEDQKALDVLCARPDVDSTNVGCAGLSGGGLRTVLIGGMDPRIKCAISVGFMSTWKDFLLHKSHTHTWMLYVPLLPNELDFPEILGLRAPVPALVLNNEGDKLFSLSEMKDADKMLQAVYQKTNAPDRYHCSFYPGPHKFDAKMQEEAFAWFDRWLRN